MTSHSRPRPTRHASLLVSAVWLVVASVGGVALSADAEIVISQKNRMFEPGSATVKVGQPLVIVNDDPGTVHHAYVETDRFNFDSGDQTPGSRTTIRFPAKGTYQVLCGIHPKMRLDVHVE